MELRALPVLTGNPQRIGEVNDRVFREPLACLCTSIVCGLFRCHQEAMRIAECALIQDPFDGDILVLGPLAQGRRASRIAPPACRAERATLRLQVLGHQHAVMVLQNVPAAGVRPRSVAPTLPALPPPPQPPPPPLT